MMRSLVFIGFSLGFTLAANLETEHLGLPLDDDERLATHQILYTGACSADLIGLMHTAGHDVRLIHDDLSALIHGKASNLPCKAVRLVQGTQKSLLQYHLPEKMWTEGESQHLHTWVMNHCSKTEVGFVNQGTDIAEVYWLRDGEERVFSATLDLGERNSHWMESYLGHQFVVVNRVTKEDLLHVTVEFDGFYVVGGQPAPVHVPNEFRDMLEDRVQMTVQDEWRKSRKVSRTFTGLGFAKGRLPLDLWCSLSAYHHNNRLHMMREEWGGKGLFVNWWDVDARMIGMPWQLKKYWQSRLKTLVEAWAGIPLELTDIYGMRQYEEGARLLMHVDRINTHAASLIINVAQFDMKEPWLLQIYDFADRMHEVTMEPGDIVYYESARCLHGRMRPLNGSAYVNLFAHYRPMLDGKGDSDWYLRPNPAGTPEPIVTYDDTCPVDQTAAGAFKSCGGQKATSGEDIFRFWLDSARSA